MTGAASASGSRTATPSTSSSASSSSRKREIAKTLSPSVQDQVATGTVRILNSPHVSEGPGRIANAPVPSVFRDDRGEIHRLRISSGGKDHKEPGKSIRINLLYSKAEIMRSGYLHPLEKRDVVLSGKVEVWTLTSDATEKHTYSAGESFDIPAYVPHILFSVEDSVVAEWWEEEHSGDLKCWYYHPYRRIVDVQNGLIAPSLGVFQRLVPQDEFVDGSSASSAGAGIDRALGWWTAGFVFGCCVTGAAAAGVAFVMTSKNRRI